MRTGKDILHIALEVEECDRPRLYRALYVQRQRTPRRPEANLFGFRRARTFGLVHMSSLKQPHAVGAAIQVVRQHVEHAGDERGPHHAGFFAQRILQRIGSAREKVFASFAR